MPNVITYCTVESVGSGTAVNLKGAVSETITTGPATATCPKIPKPIVRVMAGEDLWVNVGYEAVAAVDTGTFMGAGTVYDFVTKPGDRVALLPA